MKPIEATLTLRNNRLKKLRIEKKLSQKEMAKLIGINISYYSEAECLRPTYPHVIKKICDFFELEESYLFPEETKNLKTKIVQEISKEDFEIGYREHLEQLQYKPKYEPQEIKEKIGDALSTLNERERRVIKLRFGLTPEGPMTLESLSKIFRVSKERARQIEVNAIRKLRHPSRSLDLKQFV